MTRFARKGPANKKKPLPASSWEDFKIPDVKDIADTKSEKQKERKRRRELSVSEEVTSSKKSMTFQKPNSFGSLNNLMGVDIASSLESKETDNLNRQKMEGDEKEEAVIHELTSTRTEKRRMKRIETRQGQKVCFNCRKPGHGLVDCPEVEKLQHGIDICFRCGSGEHKISQCRSKTFPKGKFPFANCFICGESGHLSRDCPENRNGVYPNGGCCLSCGSIYHFKRDCPELKVNKGAGMLSLKTADKCKSLDEEPTVQVKRKCETQEKPQKTKTKVVKF